MSCLVSCFKSLFPSNEVKDCSINSREDDRQVVVDTVVPVATTRLSDAAMSVYGSSDSSCPRDLVGRVSPYLDFTPDAELGEATLVDPRRTLPPAPLLFKMDEADDDDNLDLQDSISYLQALIECANRYDIITMSDIPESSHPFGNFYSSPIRLELEVISGVKMPLTFESLESAYHAMKFYPAHKDVVQ